MGRRFPDLALSKEAREQIKALCKRNDHRGFVAVFSDYFWIATACALTLEVHPFLYPLSILIIGARQRALASLFFVQTPGGTSESSAPIGTHLARR